MKANSVYAAISPRDDAVGLFGDGSGLMQVLNRAGLPVRSISAPRYFTAYPDTVVVDVRDAKHAVKTLAEHSMRAMCLDMTLLLFDGDVSAPTRQEIAAELNEALQNVEIRNSVLDVLLCRPLPAIADIKGAISAVDNSRTTETVVREIINCQARVRLVLESWLIAKQEPIVQQVGADRVFALLSLHGVFRRLALEATDTARLGEIKADLVMDAKLCHHLSTAPRILLPLVSELSKKLPPGVPNRRAPSRLVALDVEDFESDEFDVEQPQHQTVHAAFSAAISQVERIAELFAQSKDQQAEAMLDELILEQRKHQDGEQHLVKSLCNIANRVDARGRQDVSLKCLTRSLEFPNGIDSKLYIQIGTQLRELRQFDQSLHCYELAKQLDDGSLADGIRLHVIRLTVARGDYEKALSEYLAIPNLDSSPSELSGLGTLYRKMGQLNRARDVYGSCLNVDPESHSAFAGLAEIRKQTGKPHQAIAAYNSLIKRFQGLDNRSKKVYALALSNLFRLTMQYDECERILRELLNDFTADRYVHLQLARLLALRGNSEQAALHFEKAKGASLHELGAIIFAKASKRFDSGFVRDGLARLQPSLMPEDRGIATCLDAYDLITNAECGRAVEVLQSATFVDRLAYDFSNVLRFHAQRRVLGDFSCKSDHLLSRTAKRSDRGLRAAMNAIEIGDYNEADRLECEFFLRLVA